MRNPNHILRYPGQRWRAADCAGSKVAAAAQCACRRADHQGQASQAWPWGQCAVYQWSKAAHVQVQVSDWWRGGAHGNDLHPSHCLLLQG